MSGISALISKLKNLQSKTKVEPKKISVVRYEIGKPVVFPENCNETGILLVPKVLTEEEWENADFFSEIEIG